MKFVDDVDDDDDVTVVFGNVIPRWTLDSELMRLSVATCCTCQLHNQTR